VEVGTEIKPPPPWVSGLLDMVVVELLELEERLEVGGGWEVKGPSIIEDEH
jgi:hypothetical protein